jgi:lysozyme
MQTSPNGRRLIESFEGLRLESYQDQVGVWTVGYGSTTDVYPHMTITPEEADERLAIDLSHAEQGVFDNVTVVGITQNMFDALVSLTFNIGVGAFKKSTVLRELNDSHIQAAADAFLMWNKAGGQVNKGLANRRAAERALFLEPQ